MEPPLAPTPPHKPEARSRSRSIPNRNGRGYDYSMYLMSGGSVVGAPTTSRVCIVSCDTASRYAPYSYASPLHDGRAIKTRPSRLRKPSDTWAPGLGVGRVCYEGMCVRGLHPTLPPVEASAAIHRRPPTGDRQVEDEPVRYWGCGHSHSTSYVRCTFAMPAAAP